MRSSSKNHLPCDFFDIVVSVWNPQTNSIRNTRGSAPKTCPEAPRHLDTWQPMHKAPQSIYSFKGITVTLDICQTPNKPLVQGSWQSTWGTLNNATFPDAISSWSWVFDSCCDKKQVLCWKPMRHSKWGAWHPECKDWEVVQCPFGAHSPLLSNWLLIRKWKYYFFQFEGIFLKMPIFKGHKCFLSYLDLAT